MWVTTTNGEEAWVDKNSKWSYETEAQRVDKFLARRRQEGGNHYKQNKIQPWDVIDEYGLDFYEGNAIKYILRNKGNRLEDLKKAAHYLEKKIEMEAANEQGQ